MSHGTNDDRHEDRFPLDLGNPVELIVGNPNGGVLVRATDRDDVLVRHVKHGRPGSHRYDDAEVALVVENNRIEARVRIPGGVGGWDDLDININLADLNPFGGGVARAEAAAGKAFAAAREAVAEVGRALGSGEVRFDLEIEVPRAAVETRVQVRTASGDVAIEGITGATSVATASGDVRTRDLRGEVNVQTASGDLSADGLTGRLSARTVSGDARVAAAVLDVFALQSVSGDLTLDAVLTGTEPCRAQTVSGDVGLGLAAPGGGEPDVTLALKTVSGDATVPPPFRKIDRRTWQAGGGGTRIDVQTVSGDLVARLATAAPAARRTPVTGAAPVVPTFDAAAPAPPAPPTPPAPPAPPATTADAAASVSTATPPVETPTEAEPIAATTPRRLDEATRLAVLEAVERGEIDVEEALRRLDGADSSREP